ncbi:type I toxin-antitoxin system Ibs family toxin, partial [Escherichia coli]
MMRLAIILIVLLLISFP